MRYHTAVSQYPRGIVIINNRSQRKVSKVYFLIGSTDIQIYTTESSNNQGVNIYTDKLGTGLHVLF